MSKSVVSSSAVADPCLIPNHAKKIVQSIREIVGEQHTDDDIYSVLQECRMDPNETAQKLLYLDTFHEVKSKRDRRKESSTVATFGRGGSGGRGRNFSNFSSSDAGSGRNAPSRRENGVNHGKERGSVTSLPAAKRTKSNAMPQTTKASVAIPNGLSSLASGSTSPEVSATAVEEKKLGTEPPLPTVTEQSPVIPTQSIIPVGRNEGEKSSTPVSVSGVYSSVSDLVLVPSASQNPGAVGTIRREVGFQQKESNSMQEIKHDAVPELPQSEKTAFGTFDSTNKDEVHGESKVAESNLHLEPSESSSSPFFIPVVGSSDEAVVCSEGTSELSTISVKASYQSVPESSVREGQHVRFPSHFQVPDAVKNWLTFGSFEANLAVGINHANGPDGDNNTHTIEIESSQVNNETLGEPSPREQGVSSIFQGDNPDYPKSTSLGLESVQSSDDNVPASEDLKPVQSKPEMLMFPGGQQNPTVQNFSNYSFGFMSALPGTQFVQYEGPEMQNGNQHVSSSASQPPATTSTSPQPVLFRQPYHPNYYPYAHYVSPFYMPPIQQFINTNGLPRPPSSGSVYLPPPSAASTAASTAAPGVKFPPPPFKLGTNPGNPPPHMRVPSGYGSYTTSPVGFNPVSAMASGSSASNEDVIASQLKESHIYTIGPMSEGSPLWIPAPTQDLSRMQVSSLYNLPLQGQHLAFSPQQVAGHHGVFAGIYQTPHNANPLMQQSQPMPAAAETVVRSSSGAFQQPQLAQMNWNANY